MEIENGMFVRDVATGFEGVVTGVVNYWTGCNQALVVPKVSKDGKRMDGEWFDIERLERDGERTLELPNVDSAREPSGSDIAPPQR